jgi:hypothetical protein
MNTRLLEQLAGALGTLELCESVHIRWDALVTIRSVCEQLQALILEREYVTADDRQLAEELVRLANDATALKERPARVELWRLARSPVVFTAINRLETMAERLC